MLLKFCSLKWCNSLKISHNITFIYKDLLTGGTRTYLDIVMVELLVNSKPVRLVKLVGVYQLTRMCSMDSVCEVNRETVVMADAFEGTFKQTRNLQSS